METYRTSCIGCGAIVPAIDGPVHEYIISAPGCWQVYTEVLDRHVGAWWAPEVRQMTVDTYAIQHPTNDERRNRQSVAVHLMSLCATFEASVPTQLAHSLLGKAKRKGEFPRLEPPENLGGLTVIDVAAIEDTDDYIRTTREWAEGSWMAWKEHHPQVRTWLRELGIQLEG